MDRTVSEHGADIAGRQELTHLRRRSDSVQISCEPAVDRVPATMTPP